MPHLDLWQIIVLGCVGFVAAAVDAIAGGGGLLNVPALLLAGLPVQAALGTNKLSGIAGTATATATFAAARAIPWQPAIGASIAAFVGAALGTQTVLHMDARALRLIVTILLFAVSLVVAINPTFGQSAKVDGASRSVWRSSAVGLGVGFYDGFFGPGTGTFLVFLFVVWLGLDFLGATGMAKAANFASNLGSLIVFAMGGAIDYQVGFVMAAAAVAGSFAGARLAIVRGAPFIRYAFLAVAWLLAATLLWQAVHIQPH